MEDKMNYDNLHAAFAALKSKHRAANTANEELTVKINKLMQENLQLKGQLASLQQNLAIQKTIVANNIIGSEERKNRDYKEVGELKKKIKELETVLKK